MRALLNVMCEYHGHMSDVEEAKASSETGVHVNFYLFYSRVIPLVLSSPKYLEILLSFYMLKTNWVKSSHLPLSEIDVIPPKRNSLFDLDTLTKIVVALAGCTSKNSEIISRGFALYVTARKTFVLDFEYDAYPCIEVPYLKIQLQF